MHTILVVEDDQALNRGVALTLEQDKIKVKQAFNLQMARDFFRREQPDLIILDIHLPDGSGLDFCKEIRSLSSVPVLFLTANDLETDIITGFEMGGDDYMTKPFSLMVLRARVKAALRRRSPDSDSKTSVGDLTLDFLRMEFIKAGHSIQLSKTEQKLLRKLVANKGIILTRHQLMEAVWSSEQEFVDDNALTVTIKRLRSKLEDDPAAPKLIKTVYGLGYVWTGGSPEC